MINVKTVAEMWMEYDATLRWAQDEDAHDAFCAGIAAMLQAWSDCRYEQDYAEFDTAMLNIGDELAMRKSAVRK